MKFWTRRPFYVGALQVLGLSAISLALGMWLLPVGIGAAGLSLLLIAWAVERDTSAGR